MVDQEAQSTITPLPEEWPVPAATGLALNSVGSFDWDLDRGLLHLDAPGLEVFDLHPTEYDLAPTTLARRLPPAERHRLGTLITQVLKAEATTCSAYFRLRCRDGAWRWAHAQGRVLREESGRPHRLIGILKDATWELAHPAERPTLGEEERRRQASVLEELTAALAHAVTVRDVLEALQQVQGMRRLGAVSLILGLVEADRMHVVAQGLGEDFVPRLQYSRLEEDLPMGEVARTQTARFITSPEEYARDFPRLLPYIKAMGVRAGAYLPLIAQARPIGTLGLHYRNKNTFTPEEHSLLVALSGSLAQSLQRARLFDREHELAKGLQQAMLPRTIPQVAGARIAVRYRSAHQGGDIGGDWYDVVPLPDGQVAAVVGDVQGHDTQAAAVMGQLRIALRAYAAEGHSPATVLARASTFLGELETDRFATCLYAQADPATGALQLVRAGHIDPLLRHADGTCRPLPTAGGLPLGLSTHFEHLEYPVTRADLEPGETLLLCTDGLIERPGTDLDEGIRLLTEAVQQGPQDIEDLAESLCKVTGKYDTVEDAAGEDDMALLLLRREDEEAPQPVRRLHQYIAPADPDALVAARHLIRERVRAWGAHERSDEIELVADELITNALLHTDSGADVTVRMLQGPEHRLRVEVQDCSSTSPHRRKPGESSVSGRGLLLVKRLTDRWGVEPRGAGKCVWCEFTSQKELAP